MAFNGRPGKGGGFKGFGGGHGGHGGHGGRFGGGGNSGGFGGGKSNMHPAVCTKCGKDCEVPFRPNGSRPVFCLDCFDRPQAQGAGGFKPRFDDRPRNDRAMASTGGNDVKEQLDRLSSKLDKIINVLNTLASVQAPQKKAEDKTPAPAAKATKKKAAPKKATKKAKK